MSLWQDIKSRLGLTSDWDEEYEEFEDHAHEADSDRDDGFYGRSVYETPHGDRQSAVRRLEREPDVERARRTTERDYLRSVPAGPSSDRPSPQVKMHIVEPKSYTEAQSVADKFKQGTPVIMNMTMTQPDLAKRLIDFASGLTYGLDGGLQKVSDKVFMLTPANVDVSAGDFRSLKDKGLFSLE